MDAAKQYGPFAVAVVVGLAGFALGDGLDLMAWLGAAAIASAGVVLWDNRWGLLSSSVLGLGASGYLFSRKLDTTGAPSLCNVNEVINCDVVNTSAASELFGIPIALLGTGFFLGVAIATLLQSKPAVRLFQSVGSMSILGVLYSAYLAYESNRIGAVCVMCITIYASTVLLLWASIRGARAEGGSLFEGLGQTVTSVPALVVAFTFAGVTLVGQSTWSARQAGRPTSQVLEAIAAHKDGGKPTDGGAAPAPLPNDLARQLQMMYGTPRGPVQLEGDEPILGDPNAPYTVVEFADFGCPHCARASALLKQLVQQVPEVKVQFRVFPLSGACNPVLEGQDGPERCRAAMAAQCAANQGRFWDYAGDVFHGQPDLSDTRLAEAARNVGVDEDAFAACMVDPATLREVQKDAVAGAQVQIHGTPALYVRGLLPDGQFVEVCHGVEGILALVEAHKAGVEILPPAQAGCPTGH